MVKKRMSDSLIPSKKDSEKNIKDMQGNFSM